MRLDKVDQGTPGTRETFKPIVKGMGDEELVGQVAQGNERALSELYDRYSRPVVRPNTCEFRDLDLPGYSQPSCGSGSQATGQTSVCRG